MITICRNICIEFVLLKQLIFTKYINSRPYFSHFLTHDCDPSTIFFVNRTGQAIAALLRRLRLRAQGNESAGELRLTVLELQKWLRPQPSTSTTPALKNPFAVLEQGGHSPYSLLAKTIADQQRAIRLGTAAPHLRALDVMTDMDMRQGHFQQEDYSYDRGFHKRSSSF